MPPTPNPRWCRLFWVQKGVVVKRGDSRCPERLGAGDAPGDAHPPPPSRRRIAPWLWLPWGCWRPQLFFFFAGGGQSYLRFWGLLLIRWKHQSLHEMVRKVEGDPCRCPLVLRDGERLKTQSLEPVFTHFSLFFCVLTRRARAQPSPRRCPAAPRCPVPWSWPRVRFRP